MCNNFASFLIHKDLWYLHYKNISIHWTEYRCDHYEWLSDAYKWKNSLTCEMPSKVLREVKNHLTLRICQMNFTRNNYYFDSWKINPILIWLISHTTSLSRRSFSLFNSKFSFNNKPKDVSIFISSILWVPLMCFFKLLEFKYVFWQLVAYWH